MTTTFTMDLNVGLTQALSDGTNSYLYGVGRIAQENTAIEYFLGDALDSVRQLTDESSAVTYAASYDPYGEVLYAAGLAKSAYGYTNEYTDSYIKLIYLRSRMYSPPTGHFLTRDSWRGDENRPVSLNSWSYVEGNPVNFIDEDGHIPHRPSLQEALYARTTVPDRRDLTEWFPTAAVYMATYPEIQAIKILNSSTGRYDEIDKLAAVIRFWKLVHSGGKFDVKLKIKDQLGDPIKMGTRWYEYSTPGNVLFGFYGTAAGYDSGTLHAGAGGAQFWDLVKSLWKPDECNPEPVTIGGPDTYLDTIDDYYATDFGIWLYNNYYFTTGSFTKYQFEEALKLYPFAPNLAERNDPGDFVPNTSGSYAADQFDQ